MIFNQTYVSPPYSPLIWNDTGKYNYFYIDFKKTVTPFTLGMFVESILVYGTAPITVTNVEKVNVTTYKVYADISGLIHGLVVMSKSPTRLRLTTGKELPSFSTFTFLAGISSYIDAGYFYESVLQTMLITIGTENNSVDFWNAIDVGNIIEAATYNIIGNVAEAPTITLV